MIQTANLKLSTRLQELAPGWADTYSVWRHHKPSGASVLLTRSEMEYDNQRFMNSPEARRFREENEFVIAPDLDWLLSKLPIRLDPNDLMMRDYLRIEPLTKGKWSACYGNNKTYDEWADNPCDAACALLIKLIESGELKV